MRVTAALIVLVASLGCATIRVTDPPRTATEQFLMSQALTQAIAQLNVHALRDKKIWLETAYLSGAEQVVVNGEVRQRLFTTPEQAFAIAELRERLLQAGARLVLDKKASEVIVEVRSGAVGIDRQDNLVGIPSIMLTKSTGAPGDTPLATPEIALIKSTKQRGFAGVSIVAFRTDTGEYVTSSGPYIGRTLREDWWILGTGPRTVGDIPPTESPR